MKGFWKIHPTLLKAGFFFACSILLFACSDSKQPALLQVEGGDPQRGIEVIRAYGCDACHKIPGAGAYQATVGPPLDRWADRIYIAGKLVNNPENLKLWIMTPQAVKPKTAMPNLGVRPEEANHIAAYLFTLTGDE
jgi:cytochrome c